MNWREDESHPGAAQPWPRPGRPAPRGAWGRKPAIVPTLRRGSWDLAEEGEREGREQTYEETSRCHWNFQAFAVKSQVLKSTRPTHMLLTCCVFSRSVVPEPIKSWEINQPH
ncbi:PREDICTED: uncharacterized protein LOC105509368 [Colobus angolensis palliatus]|uniref:uncharacterized protein LOC105509368 n=1 Tax=Colobus angolensis palliatus TaxID=336983 RepID=UPI0005F4F43B|nr:PREDICTED: uncharacterized protein LOC105509368 [Colobus angolensis palliatus]